MSMRFGAAMVLALVCLPAQVSAQPREGREREPGRWSGKLKGAGPGGVLHVESEKGDSYLVTLAHRPQEISFQGTATSGFLRPGMLVQFSALIDKKGEAQEPIGELKIISPRMGVQLGLQPGAGAAAGLFSSDEEDPNKKRKKVRADTTSVLVTGTLRSIKDEKMYVLAGGLIKAELSEQCQLSFDIADVSLAREGDSVEIEGWRYADQTNQLYPRRLVIVAEKPVGPEEKRRRPIKSDERPKSVEKTPPTEESAKKNAEKSAEGAGSKEDTAKDNTTDDDAAIDKKDKA